MTNKVKKMKKKKTDTHIQGTTEQFAVHCFQRLVRRVDCLMPNREGESHKENNKKRKKEKRESLSTIICPDKLRRKRI